VSRELTASLRRAALLKAAFPDPAARREVGELRVDALEAHFAGNAIEDAIAELVMSSVGRGLEPFVAWAVLFQDSESAAVKLEEIALSIREHALTLQDIRMRQMHREERTG
jgi:hypothetical protein